MTIPTSNDNLPSAPAVAVLVPQTELETRVTSRRAELIEKLVQLKPDLTIEGAEVRGRLKTRLSQLGRIIKEGVVDGWANLNAGTTSKLDQWIVESRQP